MQELVGDKLSSEVSDRYLRPEDKSTKCCLCLCHSPKEVDWPAWGLVHPKHCSACDGGKFISQEEYEAGRLPQVKSTKKYSKERLVRRHRKARVLPINPHRKAKTPTSWVESLTGKDAAWWVSEIQRLIANHTRPTKDPWHGTTQTEKAMTDLIKLVQKHGMPKKGPQYDGNMRMACILSYVLALWYLRLHRAKIYDPRRPVRHRQAAYWSRLGYANALFLAIEDESKDAEMFPGQNWESPWDPTTTDGYFV